MIQIDMQMPYNCSECRFKTEYEFCKAKPDNFCGNTNDKVRPEWCPLKEQDNHWRFFNFRKATEEEKEYYKEEYGEYNECDADELGMIENVPGDGEEVLLWTGCGFTVDTYDDGTFEGIGEIEKGMAWRYLPEPPKGR